MKKKRTFFPALLPHSSSLSHLRKSNKLTPDLPKKTAVYNAASSTGNIIGPIVFNSKDAPDYLPGLRVVLGFFIGTAVCAVLQAVNLAFLNKMQERRRVHNGKPAKIVDASMSNKYHELTAAADAVVDESGAAAAAAKATDRGSGSASASTSAAAEEGVAGENSRIGQNAFLDMTDRENDEFVYVL